MLPYIFAFVLFLGLLPNGAMAAGSALDQFMNQFARVDVLDPPARVYDLDFAQADGPRTALLPLQGRWVLLNIWATWCAPCVTELPKLDTYAVHQNSKRLRIMAVSIDQKVDIQRIAYQMKRWGGKTLKGLHDDTGMLPNRVDTSTLPVTLAINRDGYAVAALYGVADWTSLGAEMLAQHLARDENLFMYYEK
jgi:thiol-disulfide isomerase/thioredoxin